MSEGHVEPAEPLSGAEPGEPLSGADEVNLLLDRGDSVYVVTVAGCFGEAGGTTGTAPGTVPRPGAEELRSAVAERLATIPRLRMRLTGSPGRYRLVDARTDLRRRVRVVEALDVPDASTPAGHRLPGAPAGLEALCARLSTVRLPLDEPLWELLIVPGADGTTPAAWVFRIHHALADGTTLSRILDGMFDDPDPAPDPRSAGAVAAPVPAPVAPRRQGAAYWPTLLRELVRRMPRTALLGPLGLDRGVRLLAVPLDRVKARARAAGATVNDVVLAVAGVGARAAYRAAGERAPGEFGVSVPVRLALPARSASPGRDANQTSAVVVRVPLGHATVDATLAAVAERTRRVVGRVRARPLPWFTRTRLGGRLMGWFSAHQRMIALLSTNVRGPEHRRSLCGLPVTAVWALPVLGGNVRVGLAVVSYAGTLSFTVLWSSALGPVGDAFADGVADALAELSIP